MAQVLVRGLDDRVVARLKARARANGRSLEAELRLVMNMLVARDPPSRRETPAPPVRRPSLTLLAFHA